MFRPGPVDQLIHRGVKPGLIAGFVVRLQVERTIRPETVAFEGFSQIAICDVGASDDFFHNQSLPHDRNIGSPGGILSLRHF